MLYSNENKYILDNSEELFKDIKKYLYSYLFDGEIFNINISLKKFFKLSSDELDLLKYMHFMMTNEVKKFFDILPMLMRNLSHSTHVKNEIIRSNIKSKINWINTYKLRFSKGFDDKSLFVSSKLNKSYDLEENQLLKFLIKNIIKLNEKFSYIFNNSLSDENYNDSVNIDKTFYNQLHYYYVVSRKYFKKIYFDDISDIKIVSKKHINKTLNHKNPLYNIILDVYRIYEKLFINYDILTFKSLIEKTIIKSTNPNTFYELYVFFHLIDNISGEKKLKLMYEGNDYSFISEDGLIKIYYREIPDDFYNASLYNKIIKEEYNISGGIRRPDIIIHFKEDNSYRIFEVKNTINKKYIRESIYKVMGYYKDFEFNNENRHYLFTKNFPIILVTYGGIEFKSKDQFKNKIIILNKNSFIENIEKLVRL